MKNNTSSAPFLTGSTQEIAPALEKLESMELYWLSGYCAALANERSSRPKEPLNSLSLVKTDEIPAPSKIATAVLYASQTGNSQKIAENLFQSINDKNLNQRGIDAELLSFADFNNKKLKDYQLLLIVASTHGEGEPPDDAIEFFEFIQSNRAPKLNRAKHAVLALGDSSYEHFCQTGKDFDNALIKQGSTALLERVDCDLDFEDDASEWVNNLTSHLSDIASQADDNSNQINSVAAVASAVSEAMSHSIENDQANLAAFSKNNPFEATILTSQKITGSDSTKHIQHIELSLENSGITFQPGDSLGVWAKNNDETIASILSLTNLSGEEVVDYKGVQKSLKKTLTDNLELSLINKGFVLAYSELTQSDEIKAIAGEAYSDYIKQHQIVDIIRISPISLEAQQLVDLLKPIKPRMYSIASSLEANPDEVHLTIALVKSEVESEFKSEVGSEFESEIESEFESEVESGDKNSELSKIRYGTASHFLIENLQQDEKVLVFVEPNNHFKLAEDNAPIIMIGPGTGIAPFRSFLQQREAVGASGDNWLFFGNPHFNTDFLYQTELQKYIKQGLLTHLTLAFSRDQNEKIYVQDRLLENAENIWQWLEQKNASIYVCGDMSHMAKDVHQALIEIVSRQGNLSSEEAEQFLRTLKKNNRYQRDVY